jgi:hypothetical protein
MKRFTGATAVFGVSILAVLAIFQFFNASQPQANHENTSVQPQPANNEIMKAINSGNKAVIPLTGSDARAVAPVFDASGAIVSNPSGIDLNNAKTGKSPAPATGSDMMVAPVFDTNGAVLSDPSGTIWNSRPSSLDGNVAPVFDTNGTVVSDPSGTILNENQP